MITASAALDTVELRKARGAFFTPEPIARYVTDWAVRSPAERVLEPSCGEAAFLLAAVDRLARLHGAEPTPGAAVGALDGVELHPESAALGTRPHRGSDPLRQGHRLGPLPSEVFQVNAA